MCFLMSVFLKGPSMNHAFLSLNEPVSLLATRLPCLVLLYLKWFWLRFILFITPPFQISVDPNVWVLESTTCFLVRCQGNTLQEQRTRGRGATAEVQMRATSPALIFFSSKRSSKADAVREIWICKNGKRHVFTNMSKKRKATRQNILAGGKKLKKREKKTDSSLEYRKHVFPLQLALTRCSLHESMLFN